MGLAEVRAGVAAGERAADRNDRDRLSLYNCPDGYLFPLSARDLAADRVFACFREKGWGNRPGMAFGFSAIYFFAACCLIPFSYHLFRLCGFWVKRSVICGS